MASKSKRSQSKKAAKLKADKAKRAKHAKRVERHAYALADPELKAFQDEVIERFAPAPWLPEMSRRERLEVANLNRKLITEAHRLVNEEGFMSFMVQTGPYTPESIQEGLRAEETVMQVSQTRDIGIWSHPDSPDHKLHVHLVRIEEGWAVGFAGALLEDVFVVQSPPYQLPEHAMAAEEE